MVFFPSFSVKLIRVILLKSWSAKIEIRGPIHTLKIDFTFSEKISHKFTLLKHKISVFYSIKPTNIPTEQMKFKFENINLLTANLQNIPTTYLKFHKIHIDLFKASHIHTFKIGKQKLFCCVKYKKQKPKIKLQKVYFSAMSRQGMVTTKKLNNKKDQKSFRPYLHKI